MIEVPKNLDFLEELVVFLFNILLIEIWNIRNFARNTWKESTVLENTDFAMIFFLEVRTCKACECRGMPSYRKSLLLSWFWLSKESYPWISVNNESVGHDFYHFDRKQVKLFWLRAEKITDRHSSEENSTDLRFTAVPSAVNRGRGEGWRGLCLNCSGP